MQFEFPSAVIQVFCKAPIAGQVKTRLMPELSAEQAAVVHRQLSLRTLALVSAAKLCAVQLWCAPSAQHPFFIQAARDYALSLQTQSSGDLGERMAIALRSGLESYQYAVLMGCDCPSFTRDDLVQALTALKNGPEVVLAPTEDGGYSLIGLKRPQPALFKGISWSSAKVFAETQRKIKALKLNSVTLRTQWDVDTYADYLRFIDKDNG
ncbi:MAG: glycosyltransferase [Methylococcaceae bacterium]|nr:glycosyltransferase [Methylococcaceae bacterium]